MRRSDHPELIHSLDDALKHGRIVAPFRSVYIDAARSGCLLTRARALQLADPDAVVCGVTAAHIVGWGGIEEPEALTAGNTLLDSRPGFALSRQRIPRRMTRMFDDIRVTRLSLTALDLVPTLGAKAIDDALRRGVPLADLHSARAATAGRAGNGYIQQLLSDSRDEPWSEAERVAHRALRDAGISGWRANVTISLGWYRDAKPDLCFSALALIIEIDGWKYHRDRESFVRDRRRDADLAGLGWQVVRFPASDVLRDPKGFADAVHRIITTRQRHQNSN